MGVVGLVSRGQVPSVSLGEPANGRLEQVTVMADEVRPSPGSRAECELDLGLRFGEDFARCTQASFPVKDLSSPPLDLVVEPLGLEKIVGRRVIALQRLRLGDGSQGATHGMLSIGGSHGGVATSAYFIAHIPHIGT